MKTDENLIVAAAHLSSAAPSEWAAFLVALSAYTNQRREDVVAAAPERIFLAQGRAQQCGQLFEQLQTCRAVAEKIGRGR